MSRPVAVWDFAHLAGRMEEDRPPWDFDAMTRDAVRSAAHLLDMGTGGGEQLLRFTDVLPADTTATEGWEPNLPVAREALQPYGVTVVRYDPEATSARMRRMPFPDGRFDLVLNRHEAFVAGEVQRVLSPGGLFLTQQVGGDDAHELHDLFGGSPSYPANLMPIVVGQVADAGLEIVQAQDWTGYYRFVDVAALLAYVRLVPWDAPDDFAVDRYAERLLRLHRDTQGSVIRLTMRRFWLRARRG
jgi:SAM-dependent methyltransferase